MSVRLQLHTLGDALITVGGKEVRPTSPMVFAALLYLCLERGHRVPRTALQELLFPESDERSGAHSLRQLLYKLRQLGVRLHNGDASLELPADAVADDVPAAEAIAANHGLLSRCATGLLPGYAPDVSPAFERWLEEQRASAATRMRLAMLDAMARARQAGDHMAMETIASALLRLDPLNEEATLVRAEVLALTGQKHDAVRVLERYSAEVGATDPQLRIPAEVLRRRIAERFQGSDRAAVPMLGRQEELAFLLAQFARANSGQATISVVWGEAGIGKTRLVQEFTSHLVLKNARVESAHCQAFDRERPMGALVDLVPKLLQARGALGVSPESLAQLRRLSGEIQPGQPRDADPEITAARIREAIRDLLLCVAAERPLVLIVEDAHWLDDASLRLLLGLIPSQTARLQLVITMRDRPRFPTGSRISESMSVRQLTPLPDPTAADLLVRTLGPEYSLDDSVREQCVALAAGNPLFVCSVAEHLRLRGAAPSTQSGIADLLRQRIRILDASSLLLLRTTAALGNHATPDRLRTCTGMSLEIELLSLQELADRGLVARHNGTLRCAHDLLTEVVLNDTPSAIRVALYERVAMVLEDDGISGKQVQLLWSCAECWRRTENDERAARVLGRCAEFAVEIGQAQFALTAVELARDIAPESALPELLDKAIRIADRCYRPQAVFAHATHYRRLRRQSGLDPSLATGCEIAEINAFRRVGQPIWSSLPRLRHIAHSSAATHGERLFAARLFLAVAEQHLAKAEAAALFAELEQEPFREAAPSDWRHFRMFYNALFGDTTAAAHDAHELLAELRGNVNFDPLLMYGNIGMILYRAGEMEAAFSLFHESLGEGERLDSVVALLNESTRLSSAYFNVNQVDQARAQHEYSRLLVKRNDDKAPAAFIANSIDLALYDGDFEQARALHNSLLQHDGHAMTPYNVRFTVAYDLLIQLREGTVHSKMDLQSFENMHVSGRQICDHDFFAFALAGLLQAIGEGGRAVRLLDDYVSTWRRERCAVSAPLLAWYSAAASSGATFTPKTCVSTNSTTPQPTRDASVFDG